MVFEAKVLGKVLVELKRKGRKTLKEAMLKELR